MFAGIVPLVPDKTSHGTCADPVQERLDGLELAIDITWGWGAEEPIIDVKRICDPEAATVGVAAAGMN
jgi:hypothetical protein